jgi:hypothetical protein
MRTNQDKLAILSVLGEVAHPKANPNSAWRVGADGVPRALPGTGGICYNVRVGMPALGWPGDHLEPGVSSRAKDDGENAAYNQLAMVGNRVRVASGDAKGALGYVTGKHGGIEHVLVEFDDETLEKLLPGDKLLIKARGLGLELADYPDVQVSNIDPEILDAWGIQERDGALHVPVTHTVPAKVMGSGLGRDSVMRGDYDIQTFSPDVVDDFGLEDLRLGDLVAILDADNTHGRIYRTGAVTVGVVVHSDSFVAGHGPGVTTLLSTATVGRICPVIDPQANIKALHGRRG